ncbi:cytochrome c biogenesis protein CcsA [Microbispora hainanensis]|uniref:cytochrome c biogenesis protein CcsA n=1 Tax=Microbispora TaxID=2005 RepID=UPI0011593040|nr:MULTISPECIES: cytochrome c biogenesis protein CcsA [Microbispora]NJP25489.1 cytochrome c biogenesis protein CcsA [Microbispora sp. CL1-1]TQS13449.1 c-type cytochrome biogenesis protein CcsB [Microbispora sp. SCL1-1]
MPADVNESLATLSDQLILVTVLLYLGAMICFALDLAFGRTRTVVAERRRQLVGAGGPALPEETTEAAGPQPAAWAVRAGSFAVVLTWIAWAGHLAGILTRGIAVDRWPWANMYEFVVAICFAAVTAFLVLLIRQPIRFLGAFVTVTSALGLGFAVLFLHVQAGPVMPALHSYWIAIHVTAAIVASGLFILAGVCAILYLIRRDGRPSVLPSRESLERVAHRAIVISFPIWTFAVIAGALWADRAWGRYWGWDPKEVWAFVTWVVYAAYLHARATAGWRGKAAMIVSLVAFGCLLFNLIGVNIFFSGLHSYADVPN